MSDNLPMGFDSKDLGKPAGKRQLTEEDVEYKALEVWYRTLSERKVAKELGVTILRARVLLNRALEDRRERRENHLELLRATVESDAYRMRERLWEQIEDTGSIAAMEQLGKTWDRVCKLLGINLTADAPTGPQFLVIDARPPWSREENITDAVVEEVEPPQLPDGESPGPS